MSNDVAQVLFFGAVGCVALVLAWYIFIKAPAARSAELGPWAAKRGFRFTPPQPLGWTTTGHEVSVLDGAAQGVAFQLRSSRLVNSRRGGIQGQTEILCRAHVPANARFTAVFARGPSVQAGDAVWTGDPMFDARVKSRSDNPPAALALLQPALRAALPLAVMDATITLQYAGGEIALRCDQPIWEEAQLDRFLAVLAAAASARLG